MGGWKEGEGRYEGRKDEKVYRNIPSTEGREDERKARLKGRTERPKVKAGRQFLV
jgi:hypothetical protein